MISRLLARIRVMSEPTLLIALAMMLVPVHVVSDLYLGHTTMPATSAGVELIGMALLSQRLSTRLGGFVVATAVLAEVMVLTAVYQMHPWQIDTHMIYFVMLAGISALNRVGVLLYGAAIVAVHHLALTLLLPALVYPSTDMLENVMRTALHGGIVILETAILTMSILQRNAATARIEESREQVADESHKAAAAQARAEASARETREVVAAPAPAGGSRSGLRHHPADARGLREPAPRLLPGGLAVAGGSGRRHDQGTGLRGRVRGARGRHRRSLHPQRAAGLRTERGPPRHDRDHKGAERHRRAGGHGLGARQRRARERRGGRLGHQ
jgi:hypothetical protein